MVGSSAPRCDQLGLEIESAHSGHADVEHQTAGLRGLVLAQELRRRRVGSHGEADGFEQPSQRVAHRAIVVDDEDDRFGLRRHRDLRVRLAARRGRRRRGAGSEKPTTRPPCASTIERLMWRPSPSPSRLVVKNGSKRRLAAACETPLPVSLTTSSTAAPSSAPVSMLSSRGAPAAVGHGLEAVAHQVEDHLLELDRVDLDVEPLRRELRAAARCPGRAPRPRRSAAPRARAGSDRRSPGWPRRCARTRGCGAGSPRRAAPRRRSRRRPRGGLPARRRRRGCAARCRWRSSTIADRGWLISCARPAAMPPSVLSRAACASPAWCCRARSSSSAASARRRSRW